MRKLVAGLVAGLVLGTTGTAVAAGTAGYWTERGASYSCKGISTGVVCNSGGYQVGVVPDYVFVKKQGSQVQMFGCEKYRSWASCVNGD